MEPMIIGADVTSGTPVAIDAFPENGYRSRDTLIHGASSSGKTTAALRLVSESIMKEGRTWIVITFDRTSLFDPDSGDGRPGDVIDGSRLVVAK